MRVSADSPLNNDVETVVPKLRAVATPIVSVAIPVFNGARFLPQALDSLLQQSLREIEVIISDNASTDATQDVCTAYAARDPRIRYIRHITNIGASRNWNFVAAQARGKYLKWASANDFCDATMLAKCVAVMEADPGVVLCHGRTCLIDELTNARTTYARDIAAMQRSPRERVKTIYWHMDLNNAQSGVIRLAALRLTRLEPTYPHGDLVLMAELALHGRYVLLPEILLYRRSGQETSSMQMSTPQLQAFFNPASRRVSRFLLLRRHFDYLRAVIRAPISVRDKLYLSVWLARQTYRVRRDIWEQLRVSRKC